MDEFEIKQKIENGWIKIWFAIEVVGKTEKVTEESLKTHIEKLSKAPDTIVIEKKFGDMIKAEHLGEKFKNAFSQIVEVTLLAKNMYTLINLIMAYGPSSIEVLEPKTISVPIDEAQAISNQVAGILHEFASAGIGGLIISPSKN